MTPVNYGGRAGYASGMRIRATPGIATLSAAVGGGLAGAAILSVAIDLFSSGPGTGVAAISVLALAGFTTVRQPWSVARGVRGAWGAWGAALLGGALLWRAEDVLRVVGWSVGPALLPAAAAAALAVAGCLACTPLATAAQRASPAHLLVVAASAWLGNGLSREAILLALVLTCLPEWSVETHLRFPRRVAPNAVEWGGVGAVATLVALSGWVALRTSLDPTPESIFALTTGAVAGLALPRRGWVSAAGLTLAAAGGAVGWQAGGAVAAAGSTATTALFAALGLGAGLASPRVGIVTRTSIAGIVLFAGMPFVPTAVSERMARVDATLSRDGVERVRITTAREQSVLIAARVAATGASALRIRDGRVFAELDGAVADPLTRAGEAERFAGLLATCATPHRGRARIGGDDLGLVAEALRNEGFLGIDTAIPDRALVRAQADALPALSRTLLHPSVRPISLPAPALLRGGADADAIVEIARTGWTDGRNHAPDAHGMRAARASLHPGGVYVLALGTLHLDAGTLDGIFRSMADTFPAASLWLPPSGVDTALLVGGDAPIPWTSITACAATSTAAALELRDPLALGTLALADRNALGRFHVSWWKADRGLPAAARERPSLPLSEFTGAASDAQDIFMEGVPKELSMRADARTLFLDVVRSARSGNVKEAIDQSRALAETPGGSRALDPLIRPQLELARQAMARARREGAMSKAWQEADTALASAALIHPKSAKTRCLQGELAAATSQWERAEAAFSDCATLDATVPDGLDGVALVRRTRGNLAGAEEALRQSQVRFPRRWQSSHNLGFFLFESGQFDEAERWLRQAAASQSATEAADPSPHLALARLFLATDRASLAMPAARRAAAIRDSAEAEYLQGGAQWELKQTVEAEGAFRRAIHLDARHAEAHGGLGMCQAARGDYAAAADSFRTALALSPSNTAARDNLRLLAPLLTEQER